jgi:hypothetical protein
MGYHPYQKEITLERKVELTVDLHPISLEQEEIVVKARRDNHNISSAETGFQRLKASEIEQLPTFLGSPDPIKALQYTPGIQSVGEGNAGIYVRGGTPGQNLILLDQMPLHNPSHLLGIYSVFNSLSIQNLNLIKGGIPAQYGGKLSSVIEVNTPASSEKRVSFAGNIGTLSSAGVIKGKTQNERGFFLLSARRTHLDLIKSLLIEPLSKNSSRFFRETNYHFNDIYAKYSYCIGTKDRITAQYFFSSDHYKYCKEPLSNKMNWDNWAGALIWTHQTSSNFSYKSILSYTSHSMDMTSFFEDYEFLLGSRLHTLNHKLEFLRNTANHQMRYGWELVYNNTVPEKVKTIMPDINYQDQDELNSAEANLYLNDEMNLLPKLKLNAGFRLHRIMHVGPYKQFAEDETGKRLETKSYSKYKIVKGYNFFEPRISFSYQIRPNQSIKASYTENNQNFHLAEVGSVSLPTDIWTSSTEDLPPEKARQFTLGYYRNFANNNFETSTEIYYKKLTNQIELKESVVLKMEKEIFEDQFYMGDGRAYGFEFFIKKKTGHFTGWLGYSLSKSQKRIPEINQGKYYNTKYDRRHDLSLTLNYNHNSKWSYSAAFVYATGNTMTLPVGRYIIQGNIVNDYGKINSFRMPAYHRLDLSAKYQVVKKKQFESFWTFALYNVYGRSNPYFIYFSAKGDLDNYKLDVKAKQISLFPILPSISWNFKF